MKRRGYIYCYMEVDGRRNPHLIAMEDRLLHLAAAYSDDVIGIASDVLGSKRSGLSKLEKALTEGKIQVVFIQEPSQFGSSEDFRKCLDLMIEKNVEIITPKDTYLPQSLVPSN